MTNKNISTRDLLIETAGELFAEHGFDGTSIKMIAEKSRQNIAAVNYHFGGKQNLFIETLRFVLAKIMTPIPSKKRGKGKPAELDSELTNFVSERTRFLLSQATPQWYGGLIVRAIFGAPSEVHKIGVEIFSPDFDYLTDLALHYNAAIAPSEARRWAYSVVGQIFFYVFGRNVILLANNLSSYSEDYIEAVSKQISEIALQWLKISHERKM